MIKKNKEKIPKCCECKYYRFLLTFPMCGAIGYKSCQDVWGSEECIHIFKEKERKRNEY